MQGYLSPQSQLGETVAREMQRLVPLAADAMARRIAPPVPEGREVWKARLQAEGRAFCATYPDDEVCVR